MKLWMIMTIFGKIVGVWGPLPYDMNTCLDREVEIIAEVKEKNRTVTVGDHLVRPADVLFRCRIAEKRPNLDPFP